MAEETRHAGTVIPKAMIASYIINATSVLVMMITMSFCLTDISKALASPTGYPFLQVFVDTTGSVPGTVAITCILIAAMLFAGINYMASTSRQLFAFARDQGMPFHRWISRVCFVYCRHVRRL